MCVCARSCGGCGTQITRQGCQQHRSMHPHRTPSRTPPAKMIDGYYEDGENVHYGDGDDGGNDVATLKHAFAARYMYGEMSSVCVAAMPLVSSKTECHLCMPPHAFVHSCLFISRLSSAMVTHRFVDEPEHIDLRVFEEVGFTGLADRYICLWPYNYVYDRANHRPLQGHDQQYAISLVKRELELCNESGETDGRGVVPQSALIMPGRPGKGCNHPPTGSSTIPIPVPRMDKRSDRRKLAASSRSRRRKLVKKIRKGFMCQLQKGNNVS